jgi:hypothetical protein
MCTHVAVYFKHAAWHRGFSPLHLDHFVSLSFFFRKAILLNPKRLKLFVFFYQTRSYHPVTAKSAKIIRLCDRMIITLMTNFRSNECH